MAIFLENTEVSNKKGLTIQEFNESVDYHTHLMNEAVLNSEVMFGNLMINCMQEEYRCILNEDNEAAKKNLKEWFAKIKEIIKNMINKIKDSIKNLYPKLVDKFNFIRNYAKKYEKEIKEYKGDAEVKIHNWTSNGIPQPNEIRNKLAASLRNTEKSDVQNFESVKSEILGKDQKTAKAKDLKNTAFLIAMGSNSIIKSIKNHLNNISKSVKSLQSETDKAEKENDITKAEENKKKIIVKKNKTSIGMRATFAMISLVSKSLIDAHTVCKACVVSGKKETKKSK